MKLDSSKQLKDYGIDILNNKKIFVKIESELIISSEPVRFFYLYLC